MNGLVADWLKGLIEPLTFTEKIAGLVRPFIKVDVVEFRDENNEVVSNTTVTKSFPVACGVTADECNTDEKYKDLTPDDRYRSVSYFEDQGAIVTGKTGDRVHFLSRIRYVCWLNLKKFDTEECNISHLCAASVIAAVWGNHTNTAMLQGVKVRSFIQPPKSPAIFANYTYDEEVTQYLLYPFDYLAIDFEVEYSVNASNCFDAIVLADNPC